jgi:DNA polymerase-3 subunit alpha
MLTKRGKQMIIFTLSQSNASIELLLFPEKCAESAMEFSQGQLVYIEAEVVYDKVRLSNRISIQKILSYEEARKNYAQSLVIKTNPQCLGQMEDLSTLFALHPGHCSIIFDHQNQDIHLRLKLGDDWNIEPSQAILESIQVLLGSKEVYFKYSHR